MTITTTITSLPTAPSRTDDPDTFTAKADAWVAGVNGLTSEINTWTGEVNAIFYAATTVASLPAAGTAGARSFVTDANATTFASIVAGGGSNGVPVYDDGINWRIG